MKNIMLVVDDDEMSRVILKLMFSEQFEILEAESGRQALKLLEGCCGNVDVVLLDLIMPEIDGLEVLIERRNSAYLQNVPVVVITSSENMQDQMQAFQLGASDFITKPFIPEIVCSRVNNVIESWRRMDQILSEREKLKVRAEMDLMTGLYNKSAVEARIVDCLRSSPESMHAMLIVDIDNFKSVNDMHGHMVGDHVIKIIANQISGQFRRTDIIGRIGGDEFIVFMTNIPSHDIARRKADELSMAMKYQPNLTLPANVTVSIGLAFSEIGKPDYVRLFTRSDEALYKAKQAGKACVCEYGREKPATETAEARKTILLLCENRSTRSRISSALSGHFRLMERAAASDDIALRETEPAMVLLDVSDEKDAGASLWARYLGSAVSRCAPVIAICREGNIAQYRLALDSGAMDLFLEPIEVESLRRRIERHYAELCGKQEKDD